MKLRILVLLSIFTSTVSSQDRDEEENERTRVVYFFTEIKPGGSAEKALAEYNKWVDAGADPKTLPAAMEAIYKAAGEGAGAFKKVAHLVAKGLKPDQVKDKSLKKLQISDAHSKMMAGIREAEIKRVIHEILTSKKGEWKLGRSDSGNPDSGMKSDLDQTMYVMKKGPYGDWVRDLNADKEFIREFNKRFQFIGIDALDIASIEGKQRFPDPRDVNLDFEGKFLETIDTLRRTPGAYTYPGAVVMQMQLRALLATLQGKERSFMEYELGKDGKLKELPFNKDFAKRILFGLRPALMPGHAYGAAVANYLVLQSYLKAGKIDPKYHLRVWDDCGQLLAMAEGRLKGGMHEYLDLPPEEAARRNREIVDTMFSDPIKQKRHKLALDASAKLRLIHKGGEDNLARVFGDDVPKPAGYDARVFADLAREFYELKPTDVPTEKQIKGAAAEHRRLAGEYCLESVFKSAGECVKIYRDVRFNRPVSVEGYRHLMRLADGADWGKIQKNLEFMSRTTLLYSLYDLGAWKSGKLLLRMRKQFPDMGLVEVGELWAKGRVQNLVAPLRNAALRKAMIADLHKKLSLEINLDDFTTRGAKANLSKLNEKVQANIFNQLGFKNVEAAEKVGHLLKLKKGSWSFKKFARSALWDPGSIDAIAQIARAFVMSDGDLEHVKAVMLNELLFAIPIAGQIYAVTQGGATGVVLMAGALQFPPFGIVLVVFSVGEAGYAIYDAGYAKNVRDNVVDALYRGFSGPSTRAYDSPPPQFTNNNGTVLLALSNRLARAKEKGDKAAEKELTPRVARLQHKKQAWKAFRDGSWAGNYWYEWGAQKEQKPIKVSLLGDVPPIVSFSPKGFIDFRAKFNPRKDNRRIKELEAIVDDTEKDTSKFEEYLRADHELTELTTQKERYEHAQRYLRAAVGNDRAGLSELEKRQGIPELLHKLRRDSLYPALLERAVRLKDDKGNLSTPNPDSFVDDWIKSVGDWAMRELKDKGVWTGDVDDLSARGILWSDSLVDKLKDRLHKDYERSKHLYKRLREAEKNRKEVEKIKLQRRIDMYRAARTGLAVERFDMSRMTTALLMAAVRRNPPVVDADVIVVRSQGSDPKKLDDKAEINVRIRLKADRHVYPGPYKWSLHRLNRAGATAAIGSDKLDPDIPLTAESKARLKQLLSKAGTDEVMIPVVSVFSEKMLDLSKALKGTADHLPSQKTSKGIFMGQTVPIGKPEEVEEEKEPEEPEEVAPAGPARIMMGLPQPATRNERRFGFGKIEYKWEPPSKENATYFTYNRSNKESIHAVPYLWIEWPDRPDKKRIIYEMRVSGGIPHLDIGPFRRAGSHLGADRFGWDVTGMRRRKSGKKYTIAVPLGNSYYGAGNLKVEGRLMAFGTKQKWRDKNVEPEQQLRFSLKLRYWPPPLTAEGSSRVNEYGNARGSIRVTGIQHGTRIARVEAGGMTMYRWFSGSASFRCPGLGSAPGTARVSFRNFGKDVTVQANLKTRPPKPPKKVNRKWYDRNLEKITYLTKRKDGPDRYLKEITELHERNVYTFQPSANQIVDVGQWLKHIDVAMRSRATMYQLMANKDWMGWAYFDNSSAAAIALERAEQAGLISMRYYDYVQAAAPMDRLDIVERFTKECEKWAGLVTDNKLASYAYDRVGHAYRKMADVVFRTTGDINRPNALHKTAVQHYRRAASLSPKPKKPWTDKPRVLKMDPKFEWGPR